MAGEFVDEKSWPFDAGPGQYVHEDEWGYMARRWQDTGVSGEPGDQSLKLYTAGLSSFEVGYRFGQAQIRGFIYGKKTDAVLTVPAWASGTGPRLDRVVLRLDNTGNTITPLVQVGTENLLPSVVAGDLQLGTISTNNAGVVTITSDTRVFMGSRMQFFNSTTTGFPPVPGDREPYAMAWDTALNLGYIASATTGTWVHAWGVKKLAATVTSAAGSGGGTWSIVQFPGAESYGLYEATVFDPGSFGGNPYLRLRLRVRSTTAVATTGFFSIGDIALPANYGGTTMPTSTKLLNTSFSRRSWMTGVYSEGRMWVTQQPVNTAAGGTLIQHLANEYFEYSGILPVYRFVGGLVD